MNSIDRLDVRKLKIFKSLLEEKNISKVAKQFGLTQQAVSKHLSHFRELFEDRLFVRSRNGMIPTPRAVKVGEKINSLLDITRTLLSQNEFTPADAKSVFSICATDYALQTILPSFLRQIRSKAPGIKVIVHEFEYNNMYDQLASGNLDLVFCYGHFAPEACPNLVLFKEHNVCVTSRLSSSFIGKQLLNDIACQPQLVISPSRCSMRGSTDTWFIEKRLEKNIVMSVPCFVTAADIIETTDVIAFLPSRLLPNEKVKEVLLEEMPPEFEVVAAWHNRLSQDPLCMWVVNLLRTIFH